MTIDPAVANLLAECRRNGVVLSRRDDKLHVRAPEDVFTDDLRDRLVQHKIEILGLLTPAPIPSRAVAYVTVDDRPEFVVLGAPGQTFASIKHDLAVQYGEHLAAVGETPRTLQ